jgi:hypothetical protein
MTKTTTESLLYAVCEPCERWHPFDGGRLWGDFDRCSACGEIMNLWTRASLQRQVATLNQTNRETT